MKRRVFQAKDVAKRLEISTSGLRKWALVLEDQGYRFARDEHDRRGYSDLDITLLEQVQDAVDSGETIDYACQKAINYIDNLPKPVEDIPVVMGEEKLTDVQKLIEAFHALTEVVKEQHIEIKTMKHDMEVLLLKNTELQEGQLELKQIASVELQKKGLKNYLTYSVSKIIKGMKK